MAQNDDSAPVFPGAIHRRAARRYWQSIARALRHSWVGLMVLLYLLGIAHGEPAALAVVGGLVTLTLLAAGAGLALAWWHARRSVIERPWMPWAVFCYRVGALSAAEKAEARARGAEVAARTLGAADGETLRRQGYLDVPSRLYAGVQYRVRPGRRIEILPPVDGTEEGTWPWGRHRYLCVVPCYALPAEEFAAQCVLPLRADEATILQTGHIVPTDDAIAQVF